MNHVSRRRLNRSLTIHLRLRQAPAVLAVIALLLLGGWYMASQWDAGIVRCLREYDRALTPADTASVDGIWLGGENPLDGHTCGRMRKDGTLDRHRRGSPRGDTPTP